MALEAEILGNAFSLFANALFLLPWILGGTLVGLFIFNFLQKRLRWKWPGSAILTTFLFCFLALFIVNTLNVWNGFQNTQLEQIPPDIRAQMEFQNDQVNPILFYAQSILQSLLAGMLFTIVLFPFVFLGWLLFEVLQKRFPGTWPRLIIVSFVFSLATLLLIITFPWIPVSLVYMAFFGI